jgi:RHS repeat-associated protein
MPITDYYVASDAMGSVTAILDEDGNVIERRSYDAFGEMTCMAPDGTPVAASPTGVDVGFQGQIRDDVTGLYQMGYRWYNPVLGRWISRDPIGMAAGQNLVRFVNNRPQDRIDSFGLKEDSTIERLVKRAFNVLLHPYPNPDNLKVLPCHVPDPSDNCFKSEGSFRHCLNSCIAYIQLGYLDTPSVISGPANSALKALIVQGLAMRLGGDFPWQSSCDWNDIASNNQGIVNALLDGPAVSCIETCRRQFHERLERECCPKNLFIKKNDPRCC